MSGTNEVASAKARYADAKEIARRYAAINLAQALGVNFYISSMSRRAIEAIGNQWPGELRHVKGGGWDWEQIRRRFSNELKWLDLAVWGPGERLCAVATCLAKGTYILAERIEGDPRTDCPLRGKRLLILFEAATLYAQKRRSRSRSMKRHGP